MPRDDGRIEGSVCRWTGTFGDKERTPTQGVATPAEISQLKRGGGLVRQHRRRSRRIGGGNQGIVQRCVPTAF